MRYRRMKTAIGILGITFLAAACGGGGQETDSDVLEGRGPITFVRGKDTADVVHQKVNEWNEWHPDEKVTFLELPEAADEQRRQLVRNAETRSEEYDVILIDVVWTAEFAANRWVEELPREEFDFSNHLKPPVEAATYQDRLFAVPSYSDGALLYYRSDLLGEVGAQPPQTWQEMEQICAKVRELPEGEGVGCYAGQFEKYEGLTVNFAEAVQSAGGSVVDEDGTPTVDTPEARQGLGFLVEGFKEGLIPYEALSFKEEEGRRAFEDGDLVFHRQWPYQYHLANDPNSESEVAGDFGVAPLPGLDGPGSSSLGGWNLAISSFSDNKITALDFIKWYSREDAQWERMDKASLAPVVKDPYEAEELQDDSPYLPILKESIETAEPRPRVVEYAKMTAAIQDEVYAALTGDKDTGQALADLQDRLEGLTEQT
ncbi:ABC transporter substrate-binding protein [Allosalinactinospora lopnorensis]|uniref:ABC transporter substrate-binding protein n=1 Tax=Allosalinactinospora lopnorensis TaxID=1352348 RepID=UPI000623C6C6|nr:ABC transporter substrate-binding protein [Allosalinactinospora lopnorensis]